MKRFESSIRAITALFGTLFGFGLKQILDKFPDPHSQYPLFLVALMLFLRFLLGSANHYWLEYVKPDTKTPPERKLQPITIVTDFIFLVVMGLIGVMFCYTNSTTHFLRWMFWFHMLASGWTLVYYLRERENPRWTEWMAIDGASVLLNGVFFGLSYGDLFREWRLPFGEEFGVLPWDAGSTLLLVVNVALFWWDVNFQMRVLSHADDPDPASAEVNTASTAESS